MTDDEAQRDLEIDKTSYPLNPGTVYMLTGMWPSEIEEAMKDVKVIEGTIWSKETTNGTTNQT